MHLAQWTQFAINAGDRTQFRSVNTVLADLTVPANGAKPLVTSPGQSKFGPAGVIVNCPLVSIDIPRGGVMNHPHRPRVAMHEALPTSERW